VIRLSEGSSLGSLSDVAQESSISHRLYWPLSRDRLRSWGKLVLGPMLLRTSDGQASNAESFLLRAEAPHQINAALVAPTSSENKTTGPKIKAINAERGLAEIGRLRSGLELAKELVLSPAVTDEPVCRFPVPLLLKPLLRAPRSGNLGNFRASFSSRTLHTL
jgi:hypothetical protein